VGPAVNPYGLTIPYVVFSQPSALDLGMMKRLQEAMRDTLGLAAMRVLCPGAVQLDVIWRIARVCVASGLCVERGRRRSRPRRDGGGLRIRRPTTIAGREPSSVYVCVQEDYIYIEGGFDRLGRRLREMRYPLHDAGTRRALRTIIRRTPV